MEIAIDKFIIPIKEYDSNLRLRQLNKDMQVIPI